MRNSHSQLFYRRYYGKFHSIQSVFLIVVNSNFKLVTFSEQPFRVTALAFLVATFAILISLQDVRYLSKEHNTMEWRRIHLKVLQQKLDSLCRKALGNSDFIRNVHYTKSHSIGTPQSGRTFSRMEEK